MFLGRSVLRRATGLASKTRSIANKQSSTPRFLPRAQQRFATYQRFPGRGDSSGGSNSGWGGGKRGGNRGPYSNFKPFAKVQYVWRNYQTAVLVVGTAGGTFYVVNLETVPVTNRRRFNYISPEKEKQMAEEGYQAILQEYGSRILPSSHPYTQLVVKIVQRLLPSTHDQAGEGWKVHVIDEPKEANAFVMPGGKVFVFTGLLPIAQDENGLAAVLGHEIAHNVAHHTAERLSRSYFLLAAAILVSYLYDISGQTASVFTNLFLSLPNSRTQEREADHIGLLLMAESCYDPRPVPDLWKRMAESEQKRGGAPPQFLSTHPSSSNRGEIIRSWLPEAMQKYEQSECSQTGRHIEEFRKLTDIGLASSRRIPVFQQAQSRGGDDGWPF